MKQLNKAEIIELNKKIESQFGIKDFFEKKETISEAVSPNKFGVTSSHGSEEKEGKTFYLKDKQLVFFAVDNLLIPSLKTLLQKQFLKTITVDMGAIPFVTQGADVMRPGIVKISEDVKKDEIVCVVDEKHGKTLAVCQALYSAEEMQQMQKGKVLKNLHYVGDEIWKL